MRSRYESLTLAVLLVACGETTAEPDGGTTGVDAGLSRDAGREETDAGGILDDGGAPGCPPGEHDCSGACTPDMVNEPANGCRLGCGDACPGGADAICRDDGTCGLRSCVPDTCESMAAECGIIDDGCGGRRNCGGCDAALGQSCRDGACGCVDDAHEPNESHLGLSSMTTLNDAGSETPFPIDGNLHSASDEDWYQIAIVDGADGGSPDILVELEGVPAGSDYDVAAYFDCTEVDLSENGTSCVEGASDDTVERGCTSAGRATDRIRMDTACAGFFTDDSGTLWVRVRAASWSGACVAYTVRVTVT